MNKTESVREGEELRDLGSFELTNFGRSEVTNFGSSEVTNFGSARSIEEMAGGVPNFQAPSLPDSAPSYLRNSETSEIANEFSS